MTWFRRENPRVEDELRYHRDRLVEDFIAAGMDREAAERRAFREFGNVAHLEEQVRDVRGRWIADFAQDIRYAVRTLRRSPMFAAVAVLSLALGIGANAAIFSLINAVMLRALPVADPDRLVLISRIGDDGRPLLVPYPFFEMLRDRLESVSAITALGTLSATAIIDGQDDLLDADMVSGTYFDVLGVQPAAGRLLSPADDVIAAEPAAAVISDRFWRRRFGRGPDAIGTAVTIRDRVFTIVGVMPPSFRSLQPDRTPDLVLPLQLALADDQRRLMGYNTVTVMARPRPGATVARIDAEVQALFGAFVQLSASQQRERDRPSILRQRAGARAAPDGFNPFRYDHERSLLILMGSVGLVLLLACVNLSGLLLARAAARQREIAIRLAIGAGRGRLVRQFLAESVVLAALGGSVGLLMAGWLAAQLFALFLNGRDAVTSVAPDWRVVAFTGAVAAVSCVLAGLAPALHAVRGLTPALKQVRAGGTARLGQALVVAQLAISMVLLVGAALFIGTLVKLHAVDRGFDAGGVLVVGVRSPQPYPPDRIQAVANALIERLAAMPGVSAVSATAVLPVTGSLWERTVQVEGYRFRDDEPDAASFNVIAPNYFKAIGTPLLAGRDFDTRDTAASPRVAIVNESFARYFFGSREALGRHVTNAGVTYEIVGVAGNTKYRSLRDRTIKTLYVPQTQRPGTAQPSGYHYLVRAASGDPQALVAGLARAVREADPALRVQRVRPYAVLIEQSIGAERTMATLGGAFGALAMLVAALGMFGLLAFQVARRTNELGIRVALGAGRGSLLALVLRDVAMMVAAGVALGSVAAAMTAGVARSLLYDLTPTQPEVFAAAAAALALTAMAAAWLPARRAATIDPLAALRHE
ncbi:MAG TPA: ABC transporter permease [Vicinamibacterales bacterium]|nr:ABC transporter permease [Vicinamibacterales bacterium]